MASFSKISLFQEIILRIKLGAGETIFIQASLMNPNTFGIHVSILW
jgi:hypothetical protein